MCENIFNNSIIEVEKETTDIELKALREAYPASIILRENSPFLKLLYSKLNSTNKFNELKNYLGSVNQKNNTEIQIEKVHKSEKINYGKFENYYTNFFNFEMKNLYAGNLEYTLEKKVKSA